MLGLSLTRRTFYLGTSLFAVAQALVYGVLLYGLLLIERATGGWGVGLPFFRGFWALDGALAQILVFSGPMLVLAVIGIAIGVVYKRFGSIGLYVLTIGSILGIGALTALISWQQGWASVGGWLGDQSTVALFAGWPLVVGAIVALAGYAGIRRIVP